MNPLRPKAIELAKTGMRIYDIAAEFDAGVKAAQYGLKKSNAMSDENEFMGMGFIHQHLYAAVRRAGQLCFKLDDVWRDKANFRLFFKVWNKAALKRKLTQQLRVTRTSGRYRTVWVFLE